MITGVKSGSGSGQVQLYVDGLPSGSAGTDSLAVENTPTLVPGLGAGGSYFGGTLDETRIYNRALTASEIKSLYDLAKPDATNSASSQAQGTGRFDSGLAGYWKLDDGTSGATPTSATDSSTNGNTGTLTGGPTWTTGQIGNAVNFDGVNDYIDTGTTLVSTDSITLSAWVKGDAPTMDYPIFGHVNGQAGSDHQCLFYDNGGSENLIFGNAGGSGGNVSTAVTGLGTTWHHVVYTNQGTKNRLYLDGILVVETTSLALTSASEGYNLEIGRCQTGGGTFYFDGLIDEARVYRRALSADEVANLYRLTNPTAVDTSLKGYWSFNGKDMSGTTTAYDRSGAGNNGTLTNSPTITEGIVGQALSFNGTNNYVATGTNANITGAITVSAWAKTSSTAAGYFLANRNSSTGYGFFMGGSGNSYKLSFIYFGVTVWSSSSNAYTPDNLWHHYSVTNDLTNVRFYVDGVLVSTVAGASSGNSSPAALNLGTLIGNSIYFNGSLDEMRVYNRALTAAEIAGQYEAVKPDKVNSSITQAQGTGRLDSGLAGYWKLDATSGSTAVDSSTGGNNGTLSNMEDGDWTTGQIGNGLSFDGTNESVTVSAGTGVLNASQNVTLSTWVYPRSVGSYRGFIYKGVVGCDEASASYMLELNAGAYPTLYVGGSSLVASASALVTNQWQHLVATNSASGSAIYINGVLVKSGSALPTPSSSSEDWRFNYCNRFDGNMDEVRIYNRALSADEVSQLYRLNTPTGTDTSLKGYWSFNGKDMSGTTAYDRSGAGNNGTLTNNPTITEGKLGQALSFSETNDTYVNIGTSVALDFTSALSLSAWVKPDTANENNRGIAGRWVDGTKGYMMYLNVGKLRCYVDATYSESAATLSNAGDWYHLGCSWDGTTIRGYINGVADGTAAKSAPSIADTGMKFVIGSYGFGNPSLDNIFDGKIDEVRVYNRALSASEVLGLYNTSR